MSQALWAPWRMQYIAGPKAPGCFFCEHAVDPARFRENLVVLVQPHAMVIFNRYPFTPSHLLVAPRRHVAGFDGLTDEEYAAVTTLLRETQVRLARATSCQGMNVGFNLGKAAGAGVDDHLHGHLVPRWVGDSNFMPVVADVRVMPEYLDDAWVRLHPFFADLPGDRGPAP
jgi:ATP adenylyltransferase